MNLKRALFILFTTIWLSLTSHAHQVSSIDFKFRAENSQWLLTGQMDVAFMLPETRDLLGLQPLSRDAVLNAPPEEHQRILKETDKTLHQILKITFAGKEIPWKVEFPGYKNGTLTLPSSIDTEWAFVEVRLVIDRTAGSGELKIALSDDETCELIIETKENEQFNLLTSLPGYDLTLLKVERGVETVVHEQPTFTMWLHSGFRHVLPLGLDHMLFIFGLFVMVLKWRPMMWQSLLFTLSHSITLALTILGVIHLDSRLVEILIAFSIAFVGVENLFARKIGKLRYALVFAFGLIHGMGFASVLGDKLTDVPKDQLALPLVGFNVGVEIAQIVVLGISFLIFLPFLKSEKAKRIAQITASIIVALAGFGWMVERIFA